MMIDKLSPELQRAIAELDAARRALEKALEEEREENGLDEPDPDE